MSDMSDQPRHLRSSRRIGVPLDVVWDVWTDVRRLPELSASTRAVTGAPERLTATGQAFRQTARIAGKRVDVTWRVVEFRDRACLTIESTPVRGVHVRLTEQVEVAGADATVVTLLIDYDLPLGAAGRFVSRLGLERRARREADEVLEGVDRLSREARSQT